VKLYPYRRAAIPALLLCAVGTAILLAYLSVIPHPTDILASLARALGSATPQFIAACAFIENLVAINAYFPGAFVILFAMASTHGNPSSALLVFIMIAGASGTAQHLNFFAGKWLRRHIGEQPSRTGYLTGLANYWHPQLGALYSFRAGVSGVRYRHFARALSACGTWTAFWGVLMYKLGAVPLSGESFIAIFVVYLTGWLIVEVTKGARSPTS